MPATNEQLTEAKLRKHRRRLDHLDQLRDRGEPDHEGNLRERRHLETKIRELEQQLANLQETA